MIASLFEEARQYINHFFDAVDIKKTEELVQELLLCQGSIILSGVGKSGIIANKLAMSFLSMGTKALFLPPLDALHGDLGLVSAEDVCIFLSKSGETQELLQMIPYIRKKGAKVVAIISNPHSRLAKESDFFIILPVEKELCPFNLAPTTSTAVQLIFGDVLAVALMREKKFTLSEFAINHPAGSIGKKIALCVEDLMFKEKEIPLCSCDSFVIDVLTELSSKKCGALIVVNKEKQLEGVFTDGDLRRAIQKYGKEFLSQKVKDLMTPSPKSTTKKTLAWQAMKQMEEDPKKLITILPVVEEKKVVGVIRLHDILQAGLSREEK
jgi:arabinose-5-phosphate isomerase